MFVNFLKTSNNTRQHMKKMEPKNGMALLLAALIWGIAFVAQSVGMDYMGPWTFNGIRFLMGAVVLIPFILFRDRKKNRKKQYKIHDTIIGGLLCGLALTAATTIQQYGIMYTTVGKAGFITALYIVIVPILGIFLNRKVPPLIWAGVFISVTGLYFLSVTENFSIGKGDILILICAFLFSIQILFIDKYAPKTNVIILSFIQFVTVGIICTSVCLIIEHPTLSGLKSGIWPLLYTGILSSGVAYTLQIVGQKGMDPTISSLILCLESVISVLSGWIILGQKLSTRELFGCLLVFIALSIVQIPQKKKNMKLKPEPKT